MSSKRFEHLGHLRKIREEALGLRYAQAVGRINALLTRRQEIEQETVQARHEAVQNLADAGALPVTGRLWEDFLRGQQHRLRQLDRDMQEARKVAEQARRVWEQARVQVRQMEKLAERLRDEEVQEFKHRELLALDQTGLDRYRRQ
ncbi:MAG: flagellar export protein FliJ [Magnetococcus sp. WYHC-3]